MLRYIGPTLSTGEPAQSLNYDGLPAGDLDEAELTDEQVKRALASGLYEREAPPKKSKED